MDIVLGSALALGWCTYQGVRGVTETRLNNWDRAKNWKPWERWVVLYVHDFVFRFICTLAGFVALGICFFTGAGVNLLRISASGAAVLVFSFLIAIIGIGGQLHYMILLGKLPKA